MPRREQFTIASAGDDLLRDQIERRRKGVAGLDEDIAGYEANPDGMYVNTRTWSDVKGHTLAKRARKRRNAIQEEIDALVAEADRRAARTATEVTTR